LNTANIVHIYIHFALCNASQCNVMTTDFFKLGLCDEFLVGFYFTVFPVQKTVMTNDNKIGGKVGVNVAFR